MIAPRTWLTLTLGALAGAGASVAGLALFRSGAGTCGACCEDAADAGLCAGPAFDDGGAAAALRERAAEPTGGTLYRVGNGHESKERCLVDLPRSTDRVVSLPIDGGQQARVLSKDLLRRILFRDLDVFLASWRPVAPPVPETVGGRALLRSTWAGPDDDRWARRDVWVDAATRAFVRLVDRTREGHTIHDVEVLSRAPEPFDPVRTLFQVSWAPVREPRLNPRTVARFEDFVRQVGLALYVPARLPARMRRVDYAYEDRPVSRGGSGTELPVGWVSFGDGVSSLSFVSAEPNDLDRITELSKSGAGVGRDMACPSLPADAPDDLVGGDGQIRVRRRTNGCLTVLRRDGLPGGVSVMLVCQGGMPDEVPLELIRTLVRLQSLGRDRPAPTGDASSGAPEGIGSPDARPVGGDATATHR